MKSVIVLIGFLVLTGLGLTNCNTNTSTLSKDEEEHLTEIMDVATSQYKQILTDFGQAGQIPYSFKNGRFVGTDPSGWTSGFFPGTLWYFYEYTNDNFWKRKAEYYTQILEDQQYETGTHDLGFMMYCSYGNGYRITKNPDYKRVLLQSAESLSRRFSPTVGCLRSWDFPGWWKQYPVIIDNMMNLELLMWASKHSGGETFSRIAGSHSYKTMKSHYMDNYSCFHVVDYDTVTGKPIRKGTLQGAYDSSSWSRGQAWGFYGFTMMYRETADTNYLIQSRHIADYLITKLGDEYVPCWDFALSSDSGEEKDASAASIIASAMIELYMHTGEKKYLETGKNIVFCLSEPGYFDSKGENGGFLLKHSVVSKPARAGIDIPLSYADYYYIEAILRLLQVLRT